MGLSDGTYGMRIYNCFHPESFLYKPILAPPTDF